MSTINVYFETNLKVTSTTSVIVLNLQLILVLPVSPLACLATGSQVIIISVHPIQTIVHTLG